MKIKNLSKVIGILIISLMLIFLIQLPSNAVGFSASAGKTSLTTGETTTLNITVTDAVGIVYVSSSDSSVVSVEKSNVVFNDPRYASYDTYVSQGRYSDDIYCNTKWFFGYVDSSVYINC